MTVKSSKLQKALSAKGFQKSTSKHHHKFYIFYCDEAVQQLHPQPYILLNFKY